MLAVKNLFKHSIFLAGILSMALARSLHAHPGDLDSTFATNGTVMVPIPGTSTTESGNAVAVQSDGKVIIVGSADNDIAILRLNPDGTKDTTFGSGGKVAVNFSGGTDIGYAVAVLTNGNFIVAGGSTLASGVGAFLVARYLTNGVLDTTFGSNGLTQVSFSQPANSRSQANALAIQPDGKIVVVGETFVFSNPETFGIARLNVNGSLDSTFGTNGQVTTSLGSDANANAVMLQSDGKILVAGNSTSAFTNDQFTVVRYLTNGLLDTTFGTNGLTTIQPTFNRSCVANGIAMQSSGKIIVGGELDDTDINGVEGGFMVARLNANGSLDTTFGNSSGLTSVIATGSVQNNARALLVFSDDSLGLAGSLQLSGQGLNYALAAFSASGSPASVTRFSANPSATNYDEQGLAAVIITNNNVPYPVIVGQTEQNDAGDLGVADLATNVLSFGQFPVSVVQSYANAVAVQPDGKIVAAGDSGVQPNQSVSLARLNTDGTQDESFGNEGTVSVNNTNGGAGCFGLALQPDGKIITAGFSFNQTTSIEQFLLLRFTSAGVLDPTFAANGVELYNPTPGAAYEVFEAVRIQPDGKIVAAGLSQTSDYIQSILIARFLTNGTPDSSFGSNGFATILDGTVSRAIDVQILPSGKIIAAGILNNSFGAVRLNSDGSLDTAFGTGGIQTYNLGGSYEWAQSIAVQSDGKIVISGESQSPEPKAVVIRCLTNGLLDTTFGSGGIVVTNFGVTQMTGYGVRIQPNGKIVVGGEYFNETSPNWIYDFAVFRLLTNGTVDTSFGTGGLVHNAPSGYFTDSAWANGIAIQNNGSIVAAGMGKGASGIENFTFSRYLGDPVPPVISVPSNIIAEATSAAGAVVNFTTSATNSTGTVATTNVPPSGSTFPLGITTVTVTATDTNGTATNTFTVTVQDTTPPVITLLGKNPLTNNVHTVFTDPGATATDTVAGNLTGAIIVTGTVNTNFSHTYVLTYTVSDTYGNTAVTNRTVVIVTPPPSLSIALTGLTTNFNASFGLVSTVSVESTNLGNGPVQVVAADVNGDGKVDLITANYTIRTLTVLTNNGSGGFALATNINLNSYVQSVAAADVNGDGSMDLIYTGINKLTVLTNNGSDIFGLNATYGISGSPSQIVAADVTGDGIPDLIAANPNGNGGTGSLTVMTNNGIGGYGFVANQNQGVMTGFPETLAVADVNGDGRPDLISDNMSGYFAVFTNNGFATGIAPIHGGFPVETQNGSGNIGPGNFSVTAADVNNDGKVDLICANSSTNTLTVFTNNGAGIFTTNAIYTVGNNPGSVVAADVNNDGWVDLICANTNDNTLTVLTNNRSGGFVLATTLNTGNYPDSLIAADVNGDGGLDLISANFNDNTLTVWTNTPVVVTNTVKHFVISWPWPSTGYVLQQNTNLATANWTTFSGLVSSNSTSMSVTILPGVGNLFFRLWHP